MSIPELISARHLPITMEHLYEFAFQLSTLEKEASIPPSSINWSSATAATRFNPTQIRCFRYLNIATQKRNVIY